MPVQLRNPTARAKADAVSAADEREYEGWRFPRGRWLIAWRCPTCGDGICLSPYPHRNRPDEEPDPSRRVGPCHGVREAHPPMEHVPVLPEELRVAAEASLKREWQRFRDAGKALRRARREHDQAAITIAWRKYLRCLRVSEARLASSLGMTVHQYANHIAGSLGITEALS